MADHSPQHTAPAPTALAPRGVAASQFASAYVRFVDGLGAARQLPDATAAVRALAAQAGPIPAARRRGTLLMTQLRLAVGESNSYLLSARDQAHTFYAQITVGQRDGRWQVVQLTPPDFVQALAPAGPGPPPPPPGSRPVERAALQFLGGYVPWLYAHAPLHAVPNASPALQRRLKANPPRVPTTMRRLHPKLIAIAMEHHRGGWQALANVSDGSETYELVLDVTPTRGQWLIDQVSSPR